MEKERKEKLDALWNQSHLWKYMHLLAEGRKEEAEEYFRPLHDMFEREAPHLGSLYWYERNKYHALLKAVLTDFDSFKEYCLTFNHGMQRQLYEADMLS